jgi:hypothetical protein
MAKPGGRVEKGQSLRSAFSARAWNRAQDAADIVLGARPGIEAVNGLTSTLPKLEAVFRAYTAVAGSFTLAICYGHAATAQSALNPISSAGLLPQPTVPFTNLTADSFSEAEKALSSRINLECVLTTAQSGLLPLNEADVVIASQPPDVWTYAGYAITRIRVFNYSHRFARPPVQCGLNDNNAAGCLDSCQFGKVRIYGYFPINTALLPIAGAGTLVYPNHEFRWALVQL